MKTQTHHDQLDHTNLLSHKLSFIALIGRKEVRRSASSIGNECAVFDRADIVRTAARRESSGGVAATTCWALQLHELLLAKWPCMPLPPCRECRISMI